MAIVDFRHETPPLSEAEPELSPNAMAVLEKRYLKKDETGRVIETPGQLFWRVAWNLAQADRMYGSSEEQVWTAAREFYRLLSRTEFLPNSPTLMNAGLDLQQLSACFVIPVEDSLDGIFDALKWQAKIHQSGGGCIGGDAHVYTTFCGIERIGTLYDRVRAQGVEETSHARHRIMDVASLGIQTFAMDPSSGKIAPKLVTHLWRWEVPVEQQLVVRCQDGTTVATSEWHPFLVVTAEGIVERRADALHAGDLLLTPNRSIRASWPFQRVLKEDGLVLDERLAWLAGYSLGDGSLDWSSNRKANYRALRLRLYDGRLEALVFAKEVLADHGVLVNPAKDRRGLWSLTTTNRKFVPKFAKAVGLEPGPKDSLTLPEWVPKSPLPVVAGFLAGLIDSDGYVSLKRRRVEFSTVCPQLARRLVSLLSALGMNPSMRPKPPTGRSKHIEYRIHMADAKKTPELVALVRSMVHNPFRRERLDSLTARVAHNSHPRIPVPFDLLARLLEAAGVATKGTPIHNSPVRVGDERIWLHRAKWGNGIGEDKLERMVKALRPIVAPKFRGLLDQLESLSGGWTVVESVRRAESAEQFYDLTVADFNNYLAGAGVGKLAVVHNTGFGFSRLRPKGDFVKSTMGVASGPVSFMKIFDASTQTVKQGGCISTASLVRTTAGLKPLGHLLNAPPLGENFTREQVFDGSGYSPALIAQDNGLADVYVIETELGLSIQATYNHGIAVVDSTGKIAWRDASQVRPGDWVVVVKGGHLGIDGPLPPLGQQHPNATPLRVPGQMGPELAELLGLYMADGCTASGGRLIFTVGSEDLEIIERLKVLTERCFGLAPNRIMEGRGGGYVDVQWQSRVLIRWMSELGWLKSSSPEAFIPAEILGGSAATARAFLRGLFEGDGHVQTGFGYPSLTTTSDRLAREAQQILLSLGIAARRRVITNRSGAFGQRPLHTLTIVDEDSVRTFAEEIGFVSDRKDVRLMDGPRPAVNTSDVIPNQGPTLRSLYRFVGRGSGKGRLPRGANRELYRAIMHYISEKHPRHLPRKRLQRLMAKFPELAANHHLRAMGDPMRVYTRVKAVRQNRTMTADIEVPGPSSFVANGVLVHNKRRGANMGILRVDHPDILEFITCKDDLTQVTNFNISVAITDVFMEAVREGGKYDIVNPRSGEVVASLDAREVFDTIAHQAWKNGEPGLFFLDTTNRTNPVPQITDFEATNPCVTGDTLIATAGGLVPIAEIADRGPVHLDVDVRAAEAGSRLVHLGTTRALATRVWRTGVRPVYRLVTKSGYSVRATVDHRFLTPNGWRPLRELGIGEKVLIQSGEGSFPEGRTLPFVAHDVIRGKNGRTYRFRFPRKWSEDLGFSLGWLIGDGWLRAGDKNCRVGFTFASDETDAMERVLKFMTQILGRRIRPVRRENGVYHLSFHSKYVVEFFERLGVGSWQGQEKRVPASLFRAPRDSVVGFLRGLFESDGTANIVPGSNAYLRLTSTSRDLVDDVQRLLLHLGIRATVYRRTKSTPRVFLYTTVAGERRSYDTARELFELSVSKANVPRLLNLIEESVPGEKAIALREHTYFRETFEDSVVAVESVGAEEVYDLAEPLTHSFMGNGFVLHNCGEQPLLPFESCNLGSLDLDRHLVFASGKWDVDWPKLERTIRATVHMLDNVIDMNAYPIPQIEEMTKMTRKIGLGVMGFARMLFKLGVAYDSQEGVEWGRQIMKFVKDVGYDESGKLAEVRGTYPAWKGSRHEAMGIKVRNSYVTTVAPTGTLSMIADTSGGCEPEFSLIWYKNVMDGTHLPYVLEYFIEIAKKGGWWREDLLDKILKNGGSCRGLKEVPEKWQRAFAVSFDVSPEWHVRMQAAFQESCDAAVSKCITGDSWIFTERGLLQIGSLHRGEAPDSFSDRNLAIASNPGTVVAKEYYYGGVQPVVRVSTDLGLSLGGTPVHQIKVVEDGAIEWRRMASLRPGDRLLVEFDYGLFGNEHEFSKVYGHPFRYARRTNSKDIQIPYKVTVDLARLLGYLVADGGWNVNSMYVTNEDDAILKDFRATVARRFRARVGTTHDSRTRATKTAYVSSREIVSFLRDYMEMSNRAETKAIPEIILRSGREIQREFIKGLTLDGYVRRDGRLVPLTTTSRRLAEQTQMMLLNLGIPSMVSAKRIQYAYLDEANRKEESYELAILSDWRRTFVDTIGFAEPRKQRAARGSLKVPGDTYHGIPVRLADLEALAHEKVKVVHSQKFKEQMWAVPRRVRSGRELSREKLLWYLDATADLSEHSSWKRLSELVHRPYLCARVETTSYGQEEVHDFHVPSNNTFVANGFVSHNTINMPVTATVDDVKSAYLLAYELGCKGITVYRDQSRTNQVLNVGVSEKGEGKAAKETRIEVPPPAPAARTPRPRPDVITGRTQKVLTGYSSVYVTINEDEEGLFEIFAQSGRGGGYTASFTEAVARLVSLCLRSGIPVDEIIDQLEGIRSPRISYDHGEHVLSIPDAIAKALKRHIGAQAAGVQKPVEAFEEHGVVEPDSEADKEVTDDRAIVKAGLNPECPECGRVLVFEEGCVRCHSCGYSEC